MSIDLKYSGEGKAPAVKVEAGAINLRSELVQELLNLEDNSSDFNQLLATNSTNSSTLINETLDRVEGHTF